jgi:hypothetical protein
MNENVVALVVSTSNSIDEYTDTFPELVADAAVTVNCEELAVTTAYAAETALPEVIVSQTRSPAANVFAMVTVMVVVVCE